METVWKNRVMIKLLLVNDHNKFSGGGDAAMIAEKKILESNGFEVYIYSLASATSDLEYSEKEFYYQEKSENFTKKIEKFLLGNAVTKHFDKIVSKIKPEVIHFHLVSKYPIGIYNSKLIKNIKTIQTLHGPNLFCATSWGCIKKNSAPCEWGVGLKCVKKGCVSLGSYPLHLNLHTKVLKAISSKIDYFHCPSMHLYASVKRLGFKNTVYFPLAVDQEFIDTPIREEEPLVPTILFVGALVEQKGVLPLMEAFNCVLKTFPSAVLRYVGKGILENELKSRAEKYGIKDSVEFLGFVPRNKIIELYQGATIMVLPSIWQEQFGVVGIEALAQGVPCVGSNIGGIPEWLYHNEWGLLTPPREVDDLKNSIITLLRKSKSERKEMGMKGRSFVLRNYRLDAYKDNLLNLINLSD